MLSSQPIRPASEPALGGSPDPGRHEVVMTQGMHNEPAPSGYSVAAHRLGVAPGGSERGAGGRHKVQTLIVRATCPLRPLHTRGSDRRAGLRLTRRSGQRLSTAPRPTGIPFAPAAVLQPGVSLMTSACGEGQFLPAAASQAKLTGPHPGTTTTTWTQRSVHLSGACGLPSGP
jgi:hypothetical protein